MTLFPVPSLVVIDYPVWGKAQHTPRSWYNCGQQYRENGDYLNAVRCYENGSIMTGVDNPNQEDARQWCLLGIVVCSESLRTYDRAMDAINELIKLNPEEKELVIYKSQLIDAARPTEGRNPMKKEKKWQTN
jgi:hypothetical protein